MGAIKLASIPPAVCKLLEPLESKIVDSVCSSAECKQMLSMVWGFLEKTECKSSQEALPPMVCEVVENQALEKKVVGAVCSKQSEVPAAECEQMLTKIWDMVAKKECSAIKLASIPPAVCKLLEPLESKIVDS